MEPILNWDKLSGAKKIWKIKQNGYICVLNTSSYLRFILLMFNNHNRHDDNIFLKVQFYRFNVTTYMSTTTWIRHADSELGTFFLLFSLPYFYIIIENDQNDYCCIIWTTGCGYHESLSCITGLINLLTLPKTSFDNKLYFLTKEFFLYVYLKAELYNACRVWFFFTLFQNTTPKMKWSRLLVKTQCFVSRFDLFYSSMAMLHGFV